MIPGLLGSAKFIAKAARRSGVGFARKSVVSPLCEFVVIRLLARAEFVDRRGKFVDL
jgi:hypothetical protein